MKKNKLLVLVGLAVASFVLLTGFRYAGGGHHGGHHGGPAMMGKHLDKMLDQIDATPEQRAQITAIKDRLVASHEARMQGDRQQHKQEMVEFWRQNNPNPAEIRARIDEKFEQRKAAAYEMADAMIEVHRILTPEQRAEVAQMMEKKFEKKEMRRGEKRAPKQQPEAK